MLTQWIGLYSLIANVNIVYGITTLDLDVIVELSKGQNPENMMSKFINALIVSITYPYYIILITY